MSLNYGDESSKIMRKDALDELSELRSGEMSEHIRKGLKKMADRRLVIGY